MATQLITTNVHQGDTAPMPSIALGYTGQKATRLDALAREALIAINDISPGFLAKYAERTRLYETNELKLNEAHSRDFEDFWEYALRVLAAKRAAESIGDTISLRENSTPGTFVPWTAEELQRRLGPVATHELPRHNEDPLLFPEFLMPLAGRNITRATLADVNLDGTIEAVGEGEVDVVEHLISRYDAGITHAVVKLPGTKEAVFTINLLESAGNPKLIRKQLFSGGAKLPKKSEPETATEATQPRTSTTIESSSLDFYEDDNQELDMSHAEISDYDELGREMIGWALVRYTGTPNALLVQDWVPMSNEYRFFVVDGKIVTGAAPIEEHTPFDMDLPLLTEVRHENRPYLDLRMREVRGNKIASAGLSERDAIHGYGFTERPFLLYGKYLPFVEEQILPVLAANNLNTLVIDVAVNRYTNEPLIVELNGITNAGHYASDVIGMYEALVTAKDRGYIGYEI